MKNSYIYLIKFSSKYAFLFIIIKIINLKIIIYFIREIILFY